MRPLTSLLGESLWAGDFLRLSDNYDLGKGSGPVDVMVFDPHQGVGLGVIVVSGYKAGSTLSFFPSESCGDGKRSLEVDWLLANWNNWFCYTYERDDEGGLVPIPVEGTMVIGWEEREIVVKKNAHSRPA